MHYAKTLTAVFDDVSAQGPDLVTTSSELIHSGELTKVSVHGWHQDRLFFLFDHLMVYLRKVCLSLCRLGFSKFIGAYVT